MKIFKVCLKIYLLIILILVSAVNFDNRADSRTFSPIAFQKGMCFATWEKHRFATTYADQALEMLKEMGVEYVQVNVTIFQDKYNSTKIKSTDSTASDVSIEHALARAHKLGLKTMLKPHLDLLDTSDGTYWRADIGFQDEDDWAKWFKSYEKHICRYAKIAEKYDVEIFSVGTELSFTSQRTDYWKKLIKSVRNVYSGKLIYAANWDNYKNINFWEELDLAGIDAYFPLSYKEDPSVEDIKSGWERWKSEITAWHERVNKPVIFTEIGYTSSSSAASEPYKYETHGNANVELQARCYAAFFEAMWGTEWLHGVYWWKWAPTVNGGGNNNRQFTPLNKPASKVLAKYYLSEREKTGYTTYSNPEIEGKLKILAEKRKYKASASHRIKDKIKEFIPLGDSN